MAEVPELPGCGADGPTYETALANVLVVIEEWIETAQQLGREFQNLVVVSCTRKTAGPILAAFVWGAGETDVC